MRRGPNGGGAAVGVGISPTRSAPICWPGARHTFGRRETCFLILLAVEVQVFELVKQCILAKVSLVVESEDLRFGRAPVGFHASGTSDFVVFDK
jgi:hypothetical protein